MELLDDFTLTHAHQTCMQRMVVATLVHTIDQKGSPVKLRKLFMPLKSSIFRKKVFYRYVFCTL